MTSICGISRHLRGFTLLELIIVIIILGVLSALALPRLFQTIELSRASEAWNEIGVIRRAIERCGMFGNGTFVATECDFPAIPPNNPLAIDDPNANPASHFYYMGGGTGTTIKICAARNTLDWSGPAIIKLTPTSGGGATCAMDGGQVGVSLTVTAAGVTKAGYGAPYEGIR